MTAVPRKNAKGDSSIRLNRTGNSFSTRPLFDFSISESGSRPNRRDGDFAWADRGHFERNDRPSDSRAARWLGGVLAFVLAIFTLDRENFVLSRPYSSSSFVLEIIKHRVLRPQS